MLFRYVFSVWKFVRLFNKVFHFQTGHFLFQPTYTYILLYLYSTLLIITWLCFIVQFYSRFRVIVQHGRITQTDSWTDVQTNNHWTEIWSGLPIDWSDRPVRFNFNKSGGSISLNIWNGEFIGWRSAPVGVKDKGSGSYLLPKTFNSVFTWWCLKALP